MLRTILAILEFDDRRLSEPNPDEVAPSDASSEPLEKDLESHPEPDLDFLRPLICRPEVIVVTVVPPPANAGNIPGFPRPPPRPGNTTSGPSSGNSSYTSSAGCTYAEVEAIGAGAADPGFHTASRGSIAAERGADKETLGTVMFTFDEKRVADFALDKLPVVALAEDVTSGARRGLRLAVVSLPSPERYSSWEKKEELTELFDEKLVHDAYAFVRGMMSPLPAVPSTTIRLASCNELLRASGGGLRRWIGVSKRASSSDRAIFSAATADRFPIAELEGSSRMVVIEWADIGVAVDVELELERIVGKCLIGISISSSRLQPSHSVSLANEAQSSSSSPS